MLEFTLEKWVAFCILALPGIIAIKVYSLCCPSVQRDWKDSLVEGTGYSTIVLLLWYVLFPDTVVDAISGLVSNNREEALADAKQYRWLIPVYVLITPFVVAVGWYHVRTSRLSRWFNFDHPTQKSWDYFIGRRKNFFVLVTFKSGEQLGGCFGPNSYASTFPQEPELYLEKTWRVTSNDDGTGDWREVPGSFGTVIRQSEWEHIEFFEFKYELLADLPKTRLKYCVEWCLGVFRMLSGGRSNGRGRVEKRDSRKAGDGNSGG